mmetsp:Transcript_11325/g.36179  ORF Transcript_11325/g.36179 Transcript_11325/m.36179 type:complete len:204 (-) Transcript_11325:726-1337(-)
MRRGPSVFQVLMTRDGLKPGTASAKRREWRANSGLGRMHSSKLSRIVGMSLAARLNSARSTIPFLSVSIIVIISSTSWAQSSSSWFVSWISLTRSISLTEMFSSLLLSAPSTGDDWLFRARLRFFPPSSSSPGALSSFSSAGGLASAGCAESFACCCLATEEETPPWLRPLEAFVTSKRNLTLSSMVPLAIRLMPSINSSKSR